ncbi:MAG: hypothetical protein M5R36_24565 [Deltaproteobacteria bacterium]|nr:hypothetical protein [Deltaproteobacteria bacterium]
MRLLGRASEKFETKSLVPDELIDMLEEQTNGRVNRADVRKFQKLYFAALAAFSVRKCFYIHHYLAIRTKNGGYKTVAEMMDLDYLERKLDKFGPLVKRSRRLAAASLLFHTGWAVVRKGGFSLLAHGMRLAVLLALGFDLSKFQNKAILLGFITACDPHIHDNQMSACCGKGEVSTDVGWHDAGADANVKRERIHYLKPKNGRTQHACGG